MQGSETKTATGTGSDFNAPHQHRAVEVCLDVTAAATAAGDTLDVFVQAFVGGQYVDVIHFTQVLGNGGTKRFFAKITADLAEAMFENASALAAGSVRNLVSGRYRVRWTIGSASAPSFTFSVQASFINNNY